MTTFAERLAEARGLDWSCGVAAGIAALSTEEQGAAAAAVDVEAPPVVARALGLSITAVKDHLSGVCACFYPTTAEGDPVNTA